VALRKNTAEEKMRFHGLRFRYDGSSHQISLGVTWGKGKDSYDQNLTESEQAKRGAPESEKHPPGS